VLGFTPTLGQVRVATKKRKDLKRTKKRKKNVGKKPTELFLMPKVVR
jgi:hypothetical protein